MTVLRGQAPPPPRPWDDAPEVHFRLHKNRINMARSYDATMVTIKQLILRECAKESEGTQFVTGDDEDSFVTTDGKLNIHKFPQLPLSKHKYFIVVMYPPDDLDVDDTPMDSDEPVKFLFSFFNLYLIGFSFDDIWRVFNDAMIVGVSQESRDMYVVVLPFPGHYGSISQNYVKLDVGFAGQCDTHNKIVGVKSNTTSEDQLLEALCRIVITLPESARFPFLAQFHLTNFHTGNLNIVLDKKVPQKVAYKNYSHHLTKWGTYSGMSKMGKGSFKIKDIPTSGIKSFRELLNFIAVATNKIYDEENNQLECEVAKAQNSGDDQASGDGQSDDNGGNEEQNNKNEDSADNKNNAQGNEETWFYQAPLMPYVPHRIQNLNLVVEAVQAVSTTNCKAEVKYPIKSINILQAHGKSAKESCLPNGQSLYSIRVAQRMPSRVTPARIARLDFDLQWTKLQMGVQVLVSDPRELEKFHQREPYITNKQVVKVLKAGANVVFSTKGIDDMSLKYFVEHGATAARRLRKEDSRHVARSTGGTRVTTDADMEGEETFDPSFLGHTDEVAEEKISDDEIILVKGTKMTSTVSTIITGANDFMLDEIESSLHEALCIVKRTLAFNMIAARSDAVEATSSVYLKNEAATLGSWEQLAVGEFAESLPKVHNELTLEGPSESSGMAKSALADCTSQPLCRPSILAANLDAKCAQKWSADSSPENLAHHDRYLLGVIA